MPLFMSMAGFFAGNTFKRSWKHFFLNRSRQLLLPWLSWSLIIFATIFFLEGGKFNQAISGLFFNALWFLKSLFICGLLSLLAFKPKKYRIGLIVLSLIISQIILVWNVFTMYPCFLFGLLCSNKISLIRQQSKQLAIITGISFLFLSVWAANSPGFWVRNMGIRQMLFSGGMSVTENISFILTIVIKRYGQVLLGCLGSLFFISLFELITRNCSNSRLSKLGALGQYTLGVYAIQTVIVETVMPYFISISIDNKIAFNILVAPLISLIVVAMSLLLTWFTQNRGGIYQPSFSGANQNK